MKKIINVLIAILTVVLITSCSKNHTHSYKVTKYDETTHWLECECGEKLEEKHRYGDWITITDPSISTPGTKERECSVCHYKEKVTEGETKGLLFKLNPNKKSYSVTGINADTVENLIIPSMYNNLPVTSIGERAFFGYNRLTKVIIPNTISSIGFGAFGECENIHYNEYDNGYYLGNEENPYLVFIKAKSEDITACEIHSNTKFICEYAFSLCSNLTKVIIPNSVTSIGSSAFNGCSNLTNITIPNSVTSIGDDAFIWCENIQYNEYDNGCYLGNEENPYLVFVTAKSEDMTTCEIHSKTKLICDSAFSGCRNLTSVVIPDSVTNIGERAFECWRLTNVYYEGTIEDWCNIYFNYFVYDEEAIRNVSSNPMEYANHFFMRNSNHEWEEITSIEIPDTIKEIRSYQFYGFDNITSITIPDSVTSIEDDAFYKYEKLQCNEYDNGYYLGNEANPYLVFIEAKSRDITTCEIHSKTKFICKYAFVCENLTSITIPESVTSIGTGAFYNCSSLTSIVIPDGIISIENEAFRDCSSLTDITIPDSIISIGEKAFYNCSSLTSITIPDGVTSIRDEAFNNCRNLTSIEIPNSIASIGISSFINCLSLANVYYKGTIEDWWNIYFYHSNDDFDICSNPMSYAQHFFLKNSNHEWEEVTSIEIPDTIKEIRAFQFYGFDSITTIKIPDSVTSIGNYAFYNCSSLTSVTIPNSVTSIGDYAFYNCSSLTSITIPDNSITSIGFGVFSGCENIQYNEYDNGYYLGNEENPYLIFVAAKSRDITTCEIHSKTKLIYNGAFSLCFYLTSVTIPNSVIIIGDRAFETCFNLTSITIPNSVTSIGESSFPRRGNIQYNEYDNGYYLGNEENPYLIFVMAKSNDITTCEIHSNTRIIHSSAFSWCSNLTSVVIPESVTSIGKYAFERCSSLKEVYYKKTVSEWENIGIGDYNSDLTFATRYYYSETQPTTTGNYWHYVDGVVTKW